MIFLFLLVFELLLLFFSSKYLIQQLSLLLFRITNSKKITIYALSFLFFPGVVVHELSHAIVASVLLVKVGKIEFTPRIQERHVKLGSVAIQKTDPIRRFLIGAAPFGVGMALLYGILAWYTSTPIEFNATQIWKSVAVVCALFQISNTMFSSKTDMEGALWLFVGLSAVIVGLLLFGVQIPVDTLKNILEQNVEVLRHIVLVFLVPVAVNIGIILLIGLGYKK